MRIGAQRRVGRRRAGAIQLVDAVAIPVLPATRHPLRVVKARHACTDIAIPPVVALACHCCGVLARHASSCHSGLSLQRARRHDRPRHRHARPAHPRDRLVIRRIAPVAGRDEAAPPVAVVHRQQTAFQPRPRILRPPLQLSPQMHIELNLRAAYGPRCRKQSLWAGAPARSKQSLNASSCGKPLSDSPLGPLSS